MFVNGADSKMDTGIRQHDELIINKGVSSE
jgi:hypothetical protein